MKVNLEKFAFFPNTQQDYYDSRIATVVPSKYIFTQPGDWVLITNEPEASDEEILRHAMKSKSFEFLNDPAEDIYSLADGEPV
jgi:hypothetical protein